MQYLKRRKRSGDVRSFHASRRRQKGCTFRTRNDKKTANKRKTTRKKEKEKLENGGKKSKDKYVYNDASYVYFFAITDVNKRNSFKTLGRRRLNRFPLCSPRTIPVFSCSPTCSPFHFPRLTNREYFVPLSSNFLAR